MEAEIIQGRISFVAKSLASIVVRNLRSAFISSLNFVSSGHLPSFCLGLTG